MNTFIVRHKLWVFAAVIMVILPILFRSSQVLAMFCQMGIAILFALSYNMLLGQCGLLSFGHAVYFGLGAFFTIHALNLVNQSQLIMPTPLLPIVGGIAGGVSGVIIGLVTTRRPGATFAMISLGINELLAASALMFYGFFGSETGISAKREAWLGLKFGSQQEVYYLILIWVLSCAVLIYAFSTTPLGKIANAVRDNPERAQFVSYNPVRVRAFVLMLSGFFAGVAGGLYALNWEIVTYECIGIMQSAFVLFMVFIGGTSFFYGPILGAILVTFLTFFLSAFTEAWLFYLGLIFMIIVLFAPSGIVGIIMVHRPIWKRNLWGKLMPSYLGALLPGLVLCISGIGLVEIVYRISSGGPAKQLIPILKFRINTKGILAWIIVSVGIFVGGYFLRKSIFRIKYCWEKISEDAKNI